jgi:hypothetical protein
MKPREITFSNGFAIDLMTDESRFVGFGEVRYKGTTLRSGEMPWSLYFESDTGWRFDTFSLVSVTSTGQQATVTLTGRGSYNPRIQTGDAMGDSRFVSPRLNVPSATVSWHFESRKEVIEETSWDGLGMRIEVHSPGNPINWLLEHGTWELDGRAAGCVLIQQDVSTIDPEQQVEPNSSFSTIEAFHTRKEGAWGGSYPMDMLPRAAGAAICDFQVKGRHALCLFSEKPGLTRARLEKFADENVIHYLERPFFPLTEAASTPERTLLVCAEAEPFERHQWRNLWLDCFRHVRAKILGHYGFEPELPQPNVHAHLWDADLKKLNADWSEELKAAMPRFADLGFKQVFTHGVWESVTSDPKLGLKDGNICCPYAFRFAERFGGAAGMKALCDVARENGLDLFQWYGFQFARQAPLWKEHPEWLLKEQHGDPWDGNYGVLWCGRMRTEFAQMLKQQILDVARDTGIKGMFIDSYQNLGITCVDWQADDQAPQADEIWKLQAELQQQGFKFRCEIVTIFGVSQVGTYGFEDDDFRRRLWSDTVKNDAFFVHHDSPPGFHSSAYPFTRERVNPELYFQLAAHRAIPTMSADPWHDTPLPGRELAQEYARVNHLYNQALPRMHRLRLVPGGTHALWLDQQNRPAIIWAFAEAQTDIEGDIICLETQRRQDRINGSVTLAANRVYAING